MRNKNERTQVNTIGYLLLVVVATFTIGYGKEVVASADSLLTEKQHLKAMKAWLLNEEKERKKLIDSINDQSQAKDSETMIKDYEAFENSNKTLNGILSLIEKDQNNILNSKIHKTSAKVANQMEKGKIESTRRIQNNLMSDDQKERLLLEDFLSAKRRQYLIKDQDLFFEKYQQRLNQDYNKEINRVRIEHATIIAGLQKSSSTIDPNEIDKLMEKKKQKIEDKKDEEEKRFIEFKNQSIKKISLLKIPYLRSETSNKEMVDVLKEEKKKFYSGMGGRFRRFYDRRFGSGEKFTDTKILSEQCQKKKEKVEITLSQISDQLSNQEISPRFKECAEVLLTSRTDMKIENFRESADTTEVKKAIDQITSKKEKISCEKILENKDPTFKAHFLKNFLRRVVEQDSVLANSIKSLFEKVATSCSREKEVCNPNFDLISWRNNNFNHYKNIIAPIFSIISKVWSVPNPKSGSEIAYYLVPNLIKEIKPGISYISTFDELAKVSLPIPPKNKPLFTPRPPSTPSPRKSAEMKTK